MAKFLLWKPEYQNLNPWHSCKKPVRAVQACNASTGETKTGGARFSETLSQKLRWRGIKEDIRH